MDKLTNYYDVGTEQAVKKMSLAIVDGEFTVLLIGDHTQIAIDTGGLHLFDPMTGRAIRNSP
jgi:hypothetical protein